MNDELNLPLDGDEQEHDSIETPISAGQDDAKWKAETERARKDAAKYRTQAREAKQQLVDLQEQLSQLPKIQDTLAALQQKLDDAETKAKSAELESVRLKVASEFGIPTELATRLQGNTVEELKADAEKLVAVLPATARMPRAGQGTPPTPQSLAKDIFARINGTGQSIFDPNVHLSKKGGVQTPD